MILVRGIKGHQYAAQISNGRIGCRDLLSILSNNQKSGYRYADYYEKYVIQAFEQLSYLPLTVSPTERVIQMALSDFIPYIYVTYFHVLNDNSEKWLESFSDDYEFIYFIPILDELTGELVGDDFTGRRMEYVENISNSEKDQMIPKSFWTLHLFNGVKNEEDVGLLCFLQRVYNALLYPLFTRVKNEEYTDVENEFRILHIILPSSIDMYGNLYYKNPAHLSITFDGQNYTGFVKTYSAPNATIGKKDIIMCLNGALPAQHVSLCKLYHQGKTVSFNNRFRNIDIRSAATEYGYIGNKEKCKLFFKQAKQSKYYTKNDTIQVYKTNDLKTSAKGHTLKQIVAPFPLVCYCDFDNRTDDKDQIKGEIKEKHR